MKPLSRAELRAARVARLPDDHKGTFGHVLIAAGSRGMAGAAVLATRAALRSGAGLVTLAIPASLQAVVAGRVPEAMTIALSENSSGCLRPDAVSRLKAAHKEREYAVFAVGPGLLRHPDTARFVVSALSALDIPAVIDADALNILASQERSAVRDLLRGRRQPAIFTPHPGELARCLGIGTAEVNAHRQFAVEKLAKEWGGAALLKGHKTLISSGAKTVVNAMGGPGLAKGGTGDVLTGLIAGLWAQMLASGRVPGDAAFQAAALGAHLHGAAGDRAARDLSPWAMTAQDVVDRLGAAFQEL